MFRLSLVWLALVFLTGTAHSRTKAVQHHDELPGFEEAASICGMLPFDSEKTRCLKEIRGKAFDSKALAVCRAQGFVSHKLDCLDIISDRYFASGTEIGICKGMSFNSQQMQCLREASSGPYPLAPLASEKIDLDSLEEQIEKAMKSLERGRSDRASRILADLLHELRAAQHKKGA